MSFIFFSVTVTQDICSHTRVHDLFLESLQRSSQFLATKCASYSEIYNQNCTATCEHVLMGGDLDNNERPFGLYYVRTSSKSPFALNHSEKTKS